MKLRRRIVIEGNAPERALDRLRREGIPVFRVKKLKKNQILLRVNEKDAEKVFAIYPNVCYNISVYGGYTAKDAGAEGALKAVRRLKSRPGLAVGAALFLAAAFFADGFVLRVDVVGAEEYRRDVLAALAECGIGPFSRYSAEGAEEAAEKILALDGVGFCSVKKSGVTVTAEIRLAPFSEPSVTEGDMIAAHAGKIVQMAVLRGTPLKKAGDNVREGEPLVGGYFTDAEGNRVSVIAIARVTLSCVYEAEIRAESEAHALAQGYLAVDGEIEESACERTDGGFLVRLVYTVTETINF